MVREGMYCENDYYEVADDECNYEVGVMGLLGNE